ncbi:hypothetical protein [Sulfitobacter guttiformis]|uniref:Lipoprotein n=1 Tax=Sulfitobacter guttiformis TaxID=74349 RepID=A0A420DHK2_9RHOB|nr:hypothetical protein [Sulfitobacter guttiformis]KIN72549.1 putative lipoprotein [Sulfitobacter guttiformis KCTC 32187]RKE93706.1 hypothetical protein C8N30_2797 [Sulfitobacter guttiformis]
MRISLTVVMVASLGLGACGYVRDSALNPTNWFGRSTSGPVSDAGTQNPLIPTQGGLFARRAVEEELYIGKPFDEITDLTVERVSGGAIVRATGLAARQGIYSVQLTPAIEDETPVDGVLTYRLEGVLPNRNTATGTPPSREVTAARKVTEQTLLGVTTIRVEGLKNARTSRR